MPEESQGSWGRLADLALPALALGTSLVGRSDSNANSSLLLLFRMMEAHREHAQKQQAAQGMARVLGTDPSMPAENQVALWNALTTRMGAERLAEKERLTAAEAATTRGAHGQIASLASQVDTELPEVLRPQAAAMAGVAARDVGTQTAFDKLLTAIETSGKNLAQAQAAGRGYETVTDYPEIVARQTPVTAPLPVSSLVARQPSDQPYSLGAAMSPLSLPAMKLTTVPPDVGAAQEYIYKTGAPTEKTAPGIEAMFGLTPGGLIGSQEAARTLAAPVHAPFTHEVTDAEGNVQTVMSWIDPAGKPQSKVIGTFPRAGKPERPERPQEHEYRQSLALVAEGQPDNPLVMAAHKKLSPEVAREVLQTYRQAEQQTSPAVAAGVIKHQVDLLDEGIKRLDRIIADEKSGDRAKHDATVERRELVIRRDAKNQLFDLFVPQVAPPSSPQGPIRINVKKLREGGVVP